MEYISDYQCFDNMNIKYIKNFKGFMLVASKTMYYHGQNI